MELTISEKRDIYNTALDLHDKGYGISVIAKSIYHKLHPFHKDITYTICKDYTVKSIYDREMKQKLNGKGGTIND